MKNSLHDRVRQILDTSDFSSLPFDERQRISKYQHEQQILTLYQVLSSNEDYVTPAWKKLQIEWLNNCIKSYEEQYTNSNSDNSDHQEKHLKWFVYIDNPAKGIVPFNIFDHSSFNQAVQTLLKRITVKSEFEEQLRRELRYYFWGKCEYEVVVSEWPQVEGKESKSIKVDITDQVLLNWSLFVDYCWKFSGLN